jgi:LacI family transcriptional regulator
MTIRDVARLSGVSASTVSRVLNEDPRVTLAHRGAVHAVIEYVKFRPCSLAQGLARGRSRAFGVLTQDITSEFYGQILSGIVRALRGTGFRPIFTSEGPEDDGGDALEILLRNRVEAVIAVGCLREDRIRQVASELPFLNIGQTVPGVEERCLIVENQTGGYEATRHLLELGHRRIAHVAGPAHHRHSFDRLSGYRRALVEVGRKVDPRLIVDGDFSGSSGEAAALTLLERRTPFTAIFAANDCMAYGLMHALSREGMRIPRDVSIVGFDDRPYSAYTVPALTTMRQPASEQGAAAVEALLRELRGGSLALPTFGTPLVVRESTAKVSASLGRVRVRPRARRERPARTPLTA